MISKLKKLKVLISIVPRSKREIIVDILREYESNFSLDTNAHGTSSNDIMNLLGLDHKKKTIVLSFIREDKIKDAMLALEDKFHSYKENQSIAFSIPIESIIGMNNYLFLSNLGGKKNE